MAAGLLKTRPRGGPPALGAARQALKLAAQGLGAVLGILRAGWRGGLPLWLAAPTFVGTCLAVDQLYGALYDLSPASQWRIVEPLFLWVWGIESVGSSPVVRGGHLALRALEPEGRWLGTAGGGRTGSGAGCGRSCPGGSTGCRLCGR